MKKTEIPPRKEIMAMWDEWRDYIASGGKGSWPRDAFESILDAYDEYIKEHKISGEGLPSFSLPDNGGGLAPSFPPHNRAKHASPSLKTRKG